MTGALVHELGMRDWMIVPPDYDGIVQLTLVLCTGIVLCPKDDKAPYLVVHSGPFGDFDVLSVDSSMYGLLRAKEFNVSPGSLGRVSFQDILDSYAGHLEELEMEDNLLGGGAYVLSGLRTTPTDLLFSRFFYLANMLRGMDLNSATTMQLKPQEGKIDLYTPLNTNVDPRRTFEIGKQYNLEASL